MLRQGARPYLGAWAIWLSGYGLLLAADWVVRRGLGMPHGLSFLPVAVTTALSAGAAAGFFLAAAKRLPLLQRLLLLALQAPFAYALAVALGHGYLGAIGADGG